MTAGPGRRRVITAGRGPTGVRRPAHSRLAELQTIPGDDRRLLLKRDIDRLMQERGIDTAVVLGPVKGNATMYYMVNGAAISHAVVVKRRGEEPTLVCHPMEREEAAKSGLRTIVSSKYNYKKLLDDAEGDRLKASVAYHKLIFDELGVTGRTAFYGTVGIGSHWTLLRELARAMPGVEIAGEFTDDVFLTARATKGPEELERIREVGRLTCDVVRDTVDFIKSHTLDGDVFVKEPGAPLTIGDCKAEIRTALSRRKLIEEVDTIFAIGRDAGIPHSRGNDEDPIAVGKTIVFDIFPQEQGGGYFFDMTRTFVFGEASRHITHMYNQLAECYDTVAARLEAGAPAADYQKMTCDYFEAHGHETLRTNPQTTSGYVHGLGHGIGLQVHEKPTLADFAGNDDALDVGSVFTFEPGLYYPDDEPGFGMRIEDVYYVSDSGAIENLTNFPRDLVVEI
jgi:Xaa-Pro aminopeptidase